MDLATTTYLVVGFTFLVYIGIAIAARAGDTREFYVAGGGFILWPTAWRPPPTGCQRLRLYPWPDSLAFPITATAALFS